MPHLSPTTVQAVRDLSILAVVGHHVKLNKQNSACCPFHDEKTPSFHVYPKTNTYKCFGGCDAQGDGIGFEMRLQGIGFVDAVELLATQHGIPLEYEESRLTPEQQAAEQLRQQQRKDVSAALEWAAGWFRGQEMPAAFADRLLSDEILQLAQVGYAPDSFNALLTAANSNGLLAPILIQAGVVAQSEKDGRTNHYDTFRNRAMIPIRDARGRVVAFTGRTFSTDKEVPKYFNSPDETWQKGEHLYGLDVAAKHITKKEFAYVVEGHIDVLQMWNHGLWNTVGGAGTAFTDEQVALLARYTKHVVFVYDHDAAGRTALDKAAPKCLAAGLQVSYLVPAAPDAKGNYNYSREAESDPDSYLRGLVADSEKAPKKKRGQTAEETTPAQRLAVAVDGWAARKKDWLTCRAVVEAQKDASLGPVDRADAIRKLGDLLELMPDTTRRDTYADVLGHEWKDFKKSYKPKKRTPEKETANALAKLAQSQDKNLTDSFKFGFFEDEGSYYKIDRKTGARVRLCSFTVRILYFVKAFGQPKYVCLFSNVFKRVRPAVLSTDDFVSVSAFDKAVGRLHGFVFEGNQQDLNAIRIKLYQGIPEANEVERLGWNREGYYAWANGLHYQGNFYPADKFGFVQLRHAVPNAERVRKMRAESKLEVEGQVLQLDAPDDIFQQLTEEEVEALCVDGKVVEITYHYLPAAGDIIRGADDDNTLAKFRHFQTNKLTFKEWAARMVDVYGEGNGRTMVAFYVASLFRDLIFTANNGYFPLLYHFGLKQSGKSTAARSLARMFGIPFDNDGTNLEGGSTQTGIGRMLATVENGLIWLNEYKNTIDKRMIGTLKGIADGSGKLLGMNTSGNETKVNRSRSTAVIGGQDLPTIDPALFSRCIINEFDGRHHRPVPQKELVAIEEAGHGTAVTCEVLQHRPVLETGYRAAARTATADLTATGSKLLGTDPDSRAILNLSSLLTPVKMLLEAKALEFPFTYAELLDTLTAKLGLSTEIQSVSDEVEVYLQTLAALPAGTLQHGYHYQITKEPNNKEVLLLRTALVHPLYLEAARRQGNTPLLIGVMRNYLQKHASFVEARSHAYFELEKQNFSAYALDYYELRTKYGIAFRSETAAPHHQLPTVPAPVVEPLPAPLPLPTQAVQQANSVLDYLATSLEVGKWYSAHIIIEHYNAAHNVEIDYARFCECVPGAKVWGTPHGSRQVEWQGDSLRVVEAQDPF